MATFIFENITATQALNFNSASDILVFSNPTSSGSKMTVLYNAATATSAATVTVLDNADGKSAIFGAGVMGLGTVGGTTPLFPDSSIVAIGGIGADASGGSAANDGLFGGGGNDTLSAGSGNDLLQRNQRNDTLNAGT